MKLFERLLHLHKSPADLARGFAEYVRIEGPDARDTIPAELSAILQERNAYKEEAARIKEGRAAPWDDFKDIEPAGTGPDEEQRAAWSNQAEREAAELLAEIKAAIRSLDTLFCYVCRALELNGVTLSGGEISSVKRVGMPKTLARYLDSLKREHRAIIPAGERLDEAEAAALYEGLKDFISGPYEAFLYHLGHLNGKEDKGRGNGLKWTGTAADFAYFVRRFCEHTQRGQYGVIIRQNALCRAFGFTESQRINTIRPYIQDNKKPKGSARIDAAFKPLEASTDKPQQ